MDNRTLIIVAAVMIGVLLLMVIIRFAMFLQWFRRELQYLNKEIARTTGSEKKHWEKRKKRLWRSLIPFVGY